MRRIGVLMVFSQDDPEARARIAALRQGLDKLGWTEGRNIQVDYRWTGGDVDLAQSLAKELIALQPDVILASTTTPSIALKRETTTIPIVFVNVVDPIGNGLVASLARPAGNFTGLIHFEPSMAGKWLGMLKEVAPSVTRVAILYSPKTLPPLAYTSGPWRPPLRPLQSRQLQRPRTTPPKSSARSWLLGVCQTVG